MDEAHVDLPFGQWLKDRRKALDLTQEELSEKVGCSTAMIRKLEAGSARPSRQLAELLAAALALAPAERPAFVQRARGTPARDARPGLGPNPERPAVDVTSPRPEPDFVLTGGQSRIPQPAAAPGNLPLAPTPLVGREREAAAVRGLLWRVDVRLVTLTGPPGIGKTRLALQVAAALHGDYCDDVYFVSLAPLTDPALVPAAIAATLGVRASAGQSLPQALHDYLSLRQILLVLDNFEQVIAAASLIADLLARAPGLKVLVTSRAALRVRGEREYPVPPLGVPDPATLPDVQVLSGYEAVRLFLDRAQDVVPDFALAPANAAAIAGICRRLDGLPLALELAAARVQILSPPALLARLETGPGALDLLTGGARDLLPHQQTLRATIAWSYALLTPPEQALFRTLAVFVDGCTLEAAEAVDSRESTVASSEVLKGEAQSARHATRNLALERSEGTQHATPGTQHSALSTLDGLTALIRQSLLRRETGRDGIDRYRMLETIREYAGERLATEGAEAAVREAHARYFLALAEATAGRLRGPGAESGAARLEAEQANLRAALAWWADGAEWADRHLRLAVALAGFWRRQDHWREGLDQVTRALTRNPHPSPRRAHGLVQAAHLAIATADFTTAHPFAEEGLALSRQFDDAWGVQEALTALARVAANDGDYRESQQLLQEILDVQRALGDYVGIAGSLLALGDMAFFQGDYAQAATLYEESLGLTRRGGETRELAYLLHRVAGAAVERGDYRRAGTLLEESLALCRRLGFRGGYANALCWSGELVAQQGDYAAAEARLREGLALMEELGDNQGIPWVLRSLGWLAFRQGHGARGMALMEDSLARARAGGNQWSISGALNGLGRLACRQGEVARAAALLRESLDLAQAQGAKQYLAKGLLGSAEVAVTQGQPAESARLLGALSALLTTLDLHLGTGDQADYDAALATSRSGSGETGFAANWAAGQALSLDEAVVAARAVLDHVSSR